jgi:hypothetical protein
VCNVDGSGASCCTSKGSNKNVEWPRISAANYLNVCCHPRYISALPLLRGYTVLASPQCYQQAVVIYWRILIFAMKAALALIGATVPTVIQPGNGEHGHFSQCLKQYQVDYEYRRKKVTKRHLLQFLAQIACQMTDGWTTSGPVVFLSYCSPFPFCQEIDLTLKAAQLCVIDLWTICC